MKGGKTSTIFTIGHSNRTLEEFAALLKANNVSLVIEIRTIPRSRHNPQFNKENLPQPLIEIGIKYQHLPGLGGLRHALKEAGGAMPASGVLPIICRHRNLN